MSRQDFDRLNHLPNNQSRRVEFIETLSRPYRDLIETLVQLGINNYGVT